MNNLKMTKNYEMFKSHSYNRPLGKTHIKNIKESMMKFGFLPSSPLLVNFNFDLIDGHHRLEAAKQLDIAVYYMITDTDDITNLMVNIDKGSTPWRPSDWIYHWHNRGYSEYTRLIKIMDLGFSASMVIMVATNSYHNTTKEKVIHGDLNIEKNDFENFFYKLHSIKNLIPFIHCRSEITAIFKAYSLHDKFNFDKLIHKAKIYPTAWRRSASAHDAIIELERFYNYNNSKNRINLSEFYV